MKIITVDLSNIKSVVEAQNRFWGPLGVSAADIPFKYSNWDAFWEYFSSAISDLTKNGQEVKLIIKNASELKRFGSIHPRTDETHYDVLIEYLKDATNPELMFAHPSWAHPINFTYELIEDKPQKGKKPKR